MKTIILLFISFCFTSSIIRQSELKAENLTPKEYKTIFQLALDLPQLQPYFHVDSSSTEQQIYIKASKGLDNSKLKGVIKFGRQVLVVSAKRLQEGNLMNYFSVNNWIPGKNSLKLQLSYSLEGLLISYVFKKTNKIWSLTSFNLSEE